MVLKIGDAASLLFLTAWFVAALSARKLLPLYTHIYLCLFAALNPGFIEAGT